MPTSYDPFRAEEITVATFDAARWTRAGATPEQLADLEAEFDAATPDGQEGLTLRLASSSDGDLRASLSPQVPADPYVTPPEATEPVPSTPDAGILSEAHSEAEKVAEEAEAEAKRLLDEAEAELKRVEGLDPF
jgi:hypothetical protein